MIYKLNTSKVIIVIDLKHLDIYNFHVLKDKMNIIILV
jgi:hypothetical protein